MLPRPRAAFGHERECTKREQKSRMKRKYRRCNCCGKNHKVQDVVRLAEVKKS
jgi:hypothetical protein